MAYLRRRHFARRTVTLAFQLLAAIIIILLYFIFGAFEKQPAVVPKFSLRNGAEIQWTGFSSRDAGHADQDKAQRVVEAMKYTFWKYREHAWGADEIKPLSGGNRTSRNGWGAFIVDSASTLSLMELWDELELVVDFIINSIDFNKTEDLVDSFETTIRYLGGLVSLIDLIDSGIVPSTIVGTEKRDAILRQALLLANKLAPSYDTPSGMVWLRVNFSTNVGQDDPNLLKPGASKKNAKHPSIGPARAGTYILENRVLSRLAADPIFVVNATRAWAPLVWPRYSPSTPALVDGRIDIFTTAPVGRQRHWDSGHDSYYEYLLKAYLLSPKDQYSSIYRDRWIASAFSLRSHLVSRSANNPEHFPQHLFLGKLDGEYFLNEMSHLAHFAPGNLILGGAALDRPALVTLGKALLEGSRHTYNFSATGIGPEAWSWTPKFGYYNATFSPQSGRQHEELANSGFWVRDPRYRLRPEYVESLFYAWRITGEQRYRDWAWESYQAIERYCKAEYGFAALADVGDAVAGEGANLRHTKTPIDMSPNVDAALQLDESESFWSAETLKYFWLIFADVEKGSLNRFVYSTEGHPFRMIR